MSHAPDPATLRARVIAYVEALQDAITAKLEALDGHARFREDRWERPQGGGGRSRAIEGGAVFEKGGVNVSQVFGELPEAIAKERGPRDDPSFFATGISLVLHPRSPMVPTVHANFRYLERGQPDHPDRCRWFGGGADLTPYVLFPDDARHFHRTIHDVCERHEPGSYARLKRWCDEYFFLPHRGEARGVGGFFFDWIGADRAPDDPAHEDAFAFVRDAGAAFLPSYVPIVERRKDLPYGDAERQWQLLRRGRYVEFNLVYDRGTVFGLKTGGRTESILMSLPPLAAWRYDHHPAPGSLEAALLDVLRAPRDWLAEGGAGEGASAEP